MTACRSPFTDEHTWTPWVQERYRPATDTRVCRTCRVYEVRQHVEGTEMFPRWLSEEMVKSA